MPKVISDPIRATAESVGIAGFRFLRWKVYKVYVMGLSRSRRMTSLLIKTFICAIVLSISFVCFVFSLALAVSEVVLIPATILWSEGILCLVAGMGMIFFNSERNWLKESGVSALIDNERLKPRRTSHLNEN